MKKLAGNGLGTYSFLDEFSATGDSGDLRVGAQRRNQLKSWVIKNTRLGIPILVHGEALPCAARPGDSVSRPDWALGLDTSRTDALLCRRWGLLSECKT
jgi:hypothetical protein